MSKPPTRRRKAVAPTPPPEPREDRLWPVWSALVAEFRLWPMLIDLATSRSGWGLYGVNVISTLKTTPMGRRALAVLAEVPADLLDRLADLAAVNARRNDAIWKMAALFYVTVPVTVVLAGLQSAPTYTRMMVTSGGPFLAALIVLIPLWLLGYFSNNWRAQQIEALIELERIERAGRS